MKAYAALEAGKACFVDIPVPEPAEGEALVRNEGCVICNSTDWMVINHHFGAPGFPVLVGHESVGRVVKVGSNVQHLKIGDRVTRANAIPSGFNGEYYSAWGGFAEFGIVKDKPPVPGFGDLPLEKAGLLIALSETASCLRQFKSLQGKDVLVSGTGIAGLSLVYFAKKAGARRILCTGRRMERLETARRLGADEIYLHRGDALAKAVEEGFAADMVMEASGKFDVFEQGLFMLKEGGTFAVYGVPEKPYVIDAEKSPASYSRLDFAPREELAYEMVCRLLQEDGRLEEIFMTHQWAFDELPEAFEQVRRGDVVKGLVRMDQK